MERWPVRSSPVGMHGIAKLRSDAFRDFEIYEREPGGQWELYALVVGDESEEELVGWDDDD
jgi:hypothetical protein